MNQVKWIAFSGLAIGWLVGLSISPVIQTVLAPLVALAATVVAALSGVNKKDSDIPIIKDVRPLSILLVFLAVGATIGLLARITGNVKYAKYIGTVTSTSEQVKVDPGPKIGFFGSKIRGTDVCDKLLTSDAEEGFQLVQDSNKLEIIDRIILKNVSRNENDYRVIVREMCGS